MDKVYETAHGFILYSEKPVPSYMVEMRQHENPDKTYQTLGAAKAAMTRIINGKKG